MEEATKFEWAEFAFKFIRFVVVSVFFGVMFYVHVYIKELPIYLLAAPWALMGFDPKNLPFGIGTKK